MTPTMVEVYRPQSALHACVKVVEVAAVRRVPCAQDTGRFSTPVVDDEAVGHGMRGRIAAVPDLQPLERDGIWRVVLHGEVIVRVVRPTMRQGSAWRWQLLQMDEMTDEQLDAYEAALSNADADNRGSVGFKRQG
jgi:hypothetical protein